MQKHNVQIGTTYIVKVSDSADPVFAAMRADELEFWHELERLSQRRERYAPASDCECTDEELEMAS